ncbi:MAG: hypothetical protein BWY72_02482 [Bacteroidetes bacterium ADurb.Bin416]|nr:MAG: hypothetical protein BWY72_02482 [Bacteroidetes bacterium ADurb.Bin416]
MQAINFGFSDGDHLISSGTVSSSAELTAKLSELNAGIDSYNTAHPATPCNYRFTLKAGKLAIEQN